jgi:ferredoxin
MRMGDDAIPRIDLEKCTACGDCVEACPKDLLALHPVDHRLLVQCRNLVAGDGVLEDCRVACTACGKCVMDAGPGLISVASGVAVIDYSRAELQEQGAVERCPTGAIVWLTGAQFAAPAQRKPVAGPPSARGARQTTGSIS